MTQGFLPSVSGGQYSTLRGTGVVPSGAGGAHASQLPNTVIFAARLNSVQSGSSFAQNEWHSASVGAYTNALPGQLLLLSSTSNYLNPYFTGRVRKAFGATTAYFNETSISQVATDYLTVLDDYPIMDCLLRYLIGQATYYADYDIAYRALRPLVGSAPGSVGLHGAYAGFVDPVSSKFRISISALFYPCQSAATITSWSVNLGDGTLIAGSLTGSGTTTGTITADFPAGFRHVLITVTNSSGVSTTTAIKVWAETRSGSATLVTGLDGYNIIYDVSAPNALQSCTINVYTNELQNTLSNTPICVWDEEIVNGVLGSVGGNVRFIGRLRKEDNQNKASTTYVRTMQTAWTLEGPDTQLNRLDALKMTFQSQTVGIWGYLASLSLPKLISVLLTEFTTAANSLIVNFDDYSDLFPYPIFNTAGNTMLAVLNDVGLSIDAQMMFTGDGRTLFARHAFFQSGAARNAMTTVGNWTDQDRKADLSYSLDDIRNVSQVDAWGGVWTGGTTVIPLHAQAPGLARDIGERNIPLLKQILANVGVAAAQTELNDRAGNAWLKEAMGSRLKATHPSAYAGVLMPDISAWYTWTTSVSDSLRNYAFTTSTRWILEKLTLARTNLDGKLKVDASYLQETNGIGYGNTIAIITSNTLPTDQLNLALGTYPLILPIVPPIEMPGPDAATLSVGISKLALILSDGTLTYTTNFQQTPPMWTTPASLGVSGTVLQWIPDFHSGYYAGGGAGSKSYGWIVTTTGVYYGDINTPSFSLGHSFRATSSLRSASASLVQLGHIVVVTDYSDGTYATYATTGANWTAEASVGSGAGTLAPGCWYSQHTALVVYASANGTGYKSTDGGATWSSFATIAPGADCAADIAVPYQGGTDSDIYYVKSGSTTTVTYDFTQSDGGWTPESICGSGPLSGHYVLGQGWIGNQTTCDNAYTIDLHIPSSLTGGVLTSFTVDYTVPCGQNPAPFWTFVLGGSLHSVPSSGTPVTVSETLLSTDKLVLDNAQAQGCGAIVSKITLVFAVSGSRKLMKNAVDVSPLAGYAPWKTLPQISIALTNNSIIGVAAGDNTETNAGIFISQNGGVSWSQLIVPTTDGSTGRYDWIPMSGNSTPVLYPAGSKGRIGYSAGLSGPVADKRGNLSTSASVVGLAGYRN